MARTRRKPAAPVDMPADVAEQREEIVCFDPWAPPIPPPEIAELVDLFSLENLAEANLPTLNDPAAAWLELVGLIGIKDAVDEVDEFDFISAPPCGLALALHSLPKAERFELSRRHPLEITRVAGLAMHWLHEAGDPYIYGAVEDFLAPDLQAALSWLAENRMASFAEVLGYGDLIN